MGDQPAQIRPATKADAGSIFGLIKALAEYEELAAEVTGSEELLAAELFGGWSAAEALVAETDGKVVGFALFFPTFSTFLCQPGIWIEDIFVMPEHRRAGIGRALISQVAQIAVERGCARLEWSALDWNEAAMRFYDELRAKRMEQWQILRLEGDALNSLATTR